MSEKPVKPSAKAPPKTPPKTPAAASATAARPALKAVAAAPAKAAARPQRSLAPMIGATTAVLVIGFASAWFYVKRSERLENERVYSKPHEVAVAVKDYTVKATFAVRTNGKNADWAGSKGAVMEDIVKESLMTASPQRILTPDGMREFQNRLRKEINTRTESDRVQEVLVTDFLFSPDSN
jgi:flagellar basal body-associated protein FliL